LSRLQSLQGLRGLAALAVVLFHADLGQVISGHPSRLGPVAEFGWMGVDLFFVLSAYLLGPRFFVDGPPKGRFWAERFLRVAPAYYVACLVAAVMLLTTFPGVLRPDLAWTNLVFLQNARVETWGSLNVVFWTLAIEMQFYLVLPWMGRLFGGRRWPAWTAVFVAVSVAFRAATFGHGDGLTFGLGDRWLFAGTFLLPAFLGHFALGLAAARLPAPRRPGLVAAAGLAFVVLVAAVLTPDWWSLMLAPSWADHVLLRTLAAVGFALLVAGCAAPGPLRRVLETRPVVGLGDMSYSLYLVHFTLLEYLDTRIDKAAHPWTFAALAVAVALAGGFLLHRLVERPVERWRTTWITRRRAVETVTHFP
jgi:peptidoglycan/LPS O-acetylase OafA/YrhL